MSVRRLSGIPGFAIDQIAAQAGADPTVLRLENLDTDLLPPPAAIAATEAALRDDAANSYLPFTGSVALRERVARRLQRQTGHPYALDQVVITAGGTEGMLDTLLATTDPGDEVVLSDPTYAGMINRVRLAGAVPRLVPFAIRDGAWRLDVTALREAVGPRTRALFLMNPSIPSGAVLNAGEWWVAGPSEIMADIARVHLYNVVTATGIAQAAAVATLDQSDEDLSACVAEWQRRRDVVVEQLREWPVVPAAGGWSLLLDVAALGYDSFTASARLLGRGRVAATPMRDWGERNGDRFIRLVFSNEPVERLATLGERVRGAL